MANSRKFDCQEDYWKEYHKDELPPADAKEATRYGYDDKISYWLDYYQERIEFACANVNTQLRSAKERKKEQEFELKLYIAILIVMIVLLPVTFALPMSGVLIFMIFGGLLAIIEILAFVFMMPICVYKIVKGYVSKVINDNENSLGDRIVQKYQVPRLSGEIQACQIHIGRYKEQLANIEAWREMLKQGDFDMDESEVRNRLEKVNLDPDIEIASSNNYKLRRAIKHVTIGVCVVVFSLLTFLGVSAYIGYYDFFLHFWQQV